DGGVGPSGVGDRLELDRTEPVERVHPLRRSGLQRPCRSQRMACDEEAAGGLGRDLHARGLGSSRWSRALWAPVRIACVGGEPRCPLDFFGEAMPGAGPYDEANARLDPVRQPAAGRRRRGCAQGAIASAATISTIPFEATTRPTIVR